MQCTNMVCLQVPTTVVRRIKASCNMKNVRGARDWRRKNDGAGHRTNIMDNLIQARKAEWFVWRVLHDIGLDVTEPNFDRDERASSDLKLHYEGKDWDVEVKSCAAQKRDRNGYQLQIRRKRHGRLCVVDPWVRDKSGGDTLFFCVKVEGNRCSADTVFGMKRRDLICVDPNRKDLKGLKLAIHPRLQKANNIFNIQ